MIQTALGAGPAAAGGVPIGSADAARMDAAGGGPGMSGGRHVVAGDRDRAPRPEGDDLPAVHGGRAGDHGQAGAVDGQPRGHRHAPARGRGGSTRSARRTGPGSGHDALQHGQYADGTLHFEPAQPVNAFADQVLTMRFGPRTGTRVSMPARSPCRTGCRVASGSPTRCWTSCSATGRRRCGRR